MHLFTNDDHKPNHFKLVGPNTFFHFNIFQSKLKTGFCTLYAEPEGMLNRSEIFKT